MNDNENINDDFPEGANPGERLKIQQIADHYEAILKLIGEDTAREGLRKTPLRAARALWYVTSGLRGGNPADIMKQAIFTHEGSQMVVVRDIEFHSLCEHHVLPFFGTVSVGYIPGGHIAGLSKVARVVDAVARRLQVQERLTAQVCSAIEEALHPLGVICSCRASHLCMQMRGVEKQLASTVTTHYTGLFASEPALREEFYRMISK